MCQALIEERKIVLKKAKELQQCVRACARAVRSAPLDVQPRRAVGRAVSAAAATDAFSSRGLMLGMGDR